jgi:hypothetical protein
VRGGNLYNYTLMPTHIKSFFSIGELLEMTIAEPFTFTQYAGFVVEGTSVRVEVFGPDGTVYASVQRHRSKESGT